MVTNLFTSMTAVVMRLSTGGAMSLYETGIRPRIDSYLKEQEDKKRDYGKFWSASSAGYCMRLNILKRLKVPPVPEIAEDRPRTIRVFEAGHVFHEWVQRITKNAGLSVASEDTLQDEKLMVRGHFDDLIKLDRGYILYDYKTANSMSFNFKKDEIGHCHKMQLGTYLYMINKSDKYPKVTEGRILTISKDDLRLREQHMTFTPDVEKQVVEYWATLNGYWSKQSLPRCTCLDYDGGFMGKRSKKGKVYNDYFLNNKPCSEDYIAMHTELMKGWSL
jgi:hypothetical protein